MWKKAPCLAATGRRDQERNREAKCTPSTAWRGKIELFHCMSMLLYFSSKRCHIYLSSEKEYLSLSTSTAGHISNRVFEARWFPLVPTNDTQARRTTLKMKHGQCCCQTITVTDLLQTAVIYTWIHPDFEKKKKEKVLFHRQAYFTRQRLFTPRQDLSHSSCRTGNHCDRN